MNKLTKAGIATAAGIALLMGGAGTLAYWNDTADLTGGTITAGKLDIVSVGTGVWKNGLGTTINIANYKVGPGDTLTYTTHLDVDVVGDILTAQLALSGGSITAASTGNATANAALAGYFNSGAGVTVAASGAGVTGTGPYTITNAADDITVVVTLVFPKSVDPAPGAAGHENDAMNGVVDLSNLGIVLKQS